MVRKTLVLLGLLFLGLFPGCDKDDGSKEVIGAWKSQDNDPITGKPITLIIKDNRVLLSSNPSEIRFEKQDGVIRISQAGLQPLLLTAVPRDADTVLFTNHVFGEKVFIRTTEDDVAAILAAPPSNSESGPDPFQAAGPD